MVVISVVFMVYLILIPLGQMIIQTLTLAESDVARIEGGREGMFTLYYWKRVLTSSISKKMLWTPLANSLLIAFSTATLGVTLGSLLAWLMVRSDLLYKKFFSLALIIPYMIPSWCKSMAWLTIFKNERVGGAQGLLGFLGINTPDWLAYGPFAIVVVLVIHYYAYAYLLVSAALGSINSELEEMGEFAISLILIGIASLSVFLNQKAIGSRKSYSTIGGKGSRSNPIRLGKWRPVITGVLFVFIALAVVIPVVIPLYQSFMLEAGNYSLNNFTLHYWIGGSVPTID